MEDFSLLLEAEKRGILPQDKVALLAEARKRGLVPPLVAAPERSGLDRFGKVTRENFPLAGMMMGGAAGAIKGAALGAPGGPPGMVLGATLGGLGGGIAGGAGGSAIEQGLNYFAGEEVTPESALQNIAADTKSAAYGEMIPGIGFDAGRRVLQSPTVGKAVEWIAEAFPTGKYLLNKYASKFYREMIDARSKTLGELVGKDIPAGENVLEAGPLTKRAMKEDTKQAYKSARDIGEGEIIAVPQFRQRLGLAAQDPKIIRDPKAMEWVTKQLNASESGSMSAAQVDAAQSKINSLLWGRNPQVAENVWTNGLLADLKAWDKAQASPASLSAAYLKARSAFKNEKAFDSVYSIFRRGTKVSEDGTEFFNVGAAKVELERQRENILRQFGEKEGNRVLGILTDFLENAGKVVKEHKLREPVSAAEMMGHGGAAAAAVGFLGIPKEWIPVPYGFSLIAAHSVASPKGYFRLAQAGKLPPTSPALKMGAKMGVFKATEQDASEAPPGALPWRK